MPRASEAEKHGIPTKGRDFSAEASVKISLEILTLQGLVDFEQSLEGIQKYHQTLSLKYILPTFMDGRVRKSGKILAQLRNHYGELLCTPIRYNVRLSEVPGFGQTIFEYAPRSVGAQDYGKLTERIVANGRS